MRLDLEGMGGHHAGTGLGVDPVGKRVADSDDIARQCLSSFQTAAAISAPQTYFFWPASMFWIIGGSPPADPSDRAADIL
jgi:hypothetical protein